MRSLGSGVGLRLTFLGVRPIDSYHGFDTSSMHCHACANRRGAGAAQKHAEAHLDGRRHAPTIAPTRAQPRNRAFLMKAAFEDRCTGAPLESRRAVARPRRRARFAVGLARVTSIKFA